eukprot:TRINITY_DN4369_c0_g6_i1.p1 TRINITY_DN4369_c0_g6~~TRINITY_DN4369_c0_g6_i1.p1  ORF type:complete len:594 (+),score=97.83 TRINITY_DN4369_c0_g6_i1:34-1815(+)
MKRAFTRLRSAGRVKGGFHTGPGWVGGVQLRCATEFSIRARGEQSDANIIRVRADTKTASLSGWLTSRLRESKEPLTMTTIGMTGLNQIIKALAVTQELLNEEGLLHCKASKSETVTDRGSPASYFSIFIQLRPPADLSHHSVAPNRVGASSHQTAIAQVAESAQKLGQTCVLSVAGPESVQKALVAISSLHKYTEFLPILVKNDEGEYTAIHLKILPLPGAPKVVFVSKYTRPSKLAGFLRHVFKDENGSKVVKVIASADSHEAIRAAAKACETATDFLEQDRIPLTMVLDMVQDDDTLSSGSYVFTLTREVPKEQTAVKVTVGLGNLTVARVMDQIKHGVEGGRLVHLRSTLQGVPVTLEALSTLSEQVPVSFYSRPKEIGFTAGNDKMSTPQLDRFFVEYMVEKLVVPEVIDHKKGSEDILLRALRSLSEFTYVLKDMERLHGALLVLSSVVTANIEKCVLLISTTPHGLGLSFKIKKVSPTPLATTMTRGKMKQIRYGDGVQGVVNMLKKHIDGGEAFQTIAGNRSQMAQILRALAKLHQPFYILPEKKNERFRTLLIAVDPSDSTEPAAVNESEEAPAEPPVDVPFPI